MCVLYLGCEIYLDTNFNIFCIVLHRLNYPISVWNRPEQTADNLSFFSYKIENKIYFMLILNVF